jgi:hypothetical protein
LLEKKAFRVRFNFFVGFGGKIRNRGQTLPVAQQPIKSQYQDPTTIQNRYALRTRASVLIVCSIQLEFLAWQKIPCYTKQIITIE